MNMTNDEYTCMFCVWLIHHSACILTFTLVGLFIHHAPKRDGREGEHKSEEERQVNKLATQVWRASAHQMNSLQ